MQFKTKHTCLLANCMVYYFSANSSLAKSKITFYLMQQNRWDLVTTMVNDPGVIVSHSYPFHYASGALKIWDIFFGPKLYISLAVLNISFDRNKVDYTYRKIPPFYFRLLRPLYSYINLLCNSNKPSTFLWNISKH